MIVVKTQLTVLTVIFNFLLSDLAAQEVKILQQGEKVSLRGLSVVNDKVIWVSGSNGTIARSINGGRDWTWKKVDGYISRDFRDIEAFNSKTAVIMAVGEPAIILKTTDGGESWKKVYENATTGMFLDAIEFSSDNEGLVIGDPVNGRFFMARTNNGGNSWKELNDLSFAEKGEACFAASGTNLRINKDIYFVSGGTTSRLFINNKPSNIPLLQGKESQGANSIAISQDNIIIVGGDFNADSMKLGNCIISRNGGTSWIKPSSLPNGYRSCVEFIDTKHAITCGLTGVDISNDAGIQWNSISSTGFHVCRKAKKGSAVYLAGNNGRIGKLILK
jgi:photosystem II stability/assembly factor-like uncharacterized protein